MRVQSLSILFFSLVRSNPCPDGYNLDRSGEDCYMGINFYNSWYDKCDPKSYDEAEFACNTHSGGLLASSHNWQDNDYFMSQTCTVSGATLNIGLRCQGKVCKWNDGTPVTYTYFLNEPKDDGRIRCYAIDGHAPFGAWIEKSCGTQPADCWICRVKAKTIDCVDGETEYKGGCVSVHTTPLDQKTAEESCPGGGHLVSIHSTGDNGENELYKGLALKAGVNGSIYIGGKFSNGEFEWIDGTHYGSSNWANSFPNTIFGSCVQMLLDTEFGIQGQWTNIDCSLKQPYICFRDGADYSNYVTPTQPKADPACPPLQKFNGSGTFYSPNFPLSIPYNQTCEYWITVEEGKKAALRFPEYNCYGGTKIDFYYDTTTPYIFAEITDFDVSPSYWYYSKTNFMKLVFTVYTTKPPVGQGWEIEFKGVDESEYH